MSVKAKPGLHTTPSQELEDAARRHTLQVDDILHELVPRMRRIYKSAPLVFQFLVSFVDRASEVGADVEGLSEFLRVYHEDPKLAHLFLGVLAAIEPAAGSMDAGEDEPCERGPSTPQGWEDEPTAPGSNPPDTR